MTKNENAKLLAYEGHDGQFRKYTGEPYISHPERVHDKVTLFCLRKALPEEKKKLMQRVAWCHDIREDCPKISKERIVSETDEETFNLIEELTNPSKKSKASRAIRKQMDRDHLANVSWEARVIKLCDRIDNLSDMKKCPDQSFIDLYTNESRLLLEVLRGTDEVLEAELLDLILMNVRK
jgi:(p)ppGpp synthase/HD superfamily hydrolase